MQKIIFSLSLTLILFSFSDAQIFAQCGGNCGEQTVGNCGCDTDCWLYGDCCPDITSACPDLRPSIPSFPGGANTVDPLACNTNTSICSNNAGPFTFTSPGPPVSTCLDFFGPNVAYIMLYITQSGPLQMLINGNASTGFLDVAVFNIPNGQNPCTAIQSTSNQIGCNYASNAGGCNQFGSYYSCSSIVPSPYVTAGQTIMIVVENWSGASSSFTLSLSPTGAQSGPPNTTINTPPYSLCSNSAPITLTAVNNGGTWSGPGMSANGTFNPAAAGVGTHTINYALGVAPCNANSTTQITVSAPPTTSFTTNSPICAGQVIELNAPPVAGATYHWSGPGGWTATGANPVRPNATASMSGNYNMYMMMGGCTSATVTQNVVVNPTGPAPLVTSNSPVCYGNPIIFDGPTEPGAQYFWSGPNGWSETSEDPSIPVSDYSMAGNYSLYMIQSNGCTTAVTNHAINISVPPKPIIDPVLPLCYQSAPINMVVDLPGGTWSGTAVNASGLFDPTTAGPGAHDIIYTIPQPCGNADTFTVYVTSPIDIQGQVTHETCMGVGDGGIDLTTYGMVGNILTYLWSNGETTEDLSNINYGSYSVVVTDQFGCDYSQSFSVLAGNSLNFSYSTSNVLCYGEPTGSITVSPASGTPPYVYTVNGIQTASNPIAHLQAGTYNVTITDSRGCDTSFVTQISQPPALFADSTEYQIRLGDYKNIITNIGGGTGNLSLQWVPNYNISCTDCPDPMVWPEQNTKYVLYIEDDNGCTIEGVANINVYHDGPFIPNSFTPGKDELNNEWKVIDYGIKDFELYVFDRWGTKIFETDNIYVGWDGKLSNGNYLESGVYVYKVRIRYMDGKEKTLLGNVTLLR